MAGHGHGNQESQTPSSAKAPGADLPFRVLFESAPGLYLVLTPDDEATILAVSDALLRATNTERATIMGRSLFEVFPDDPNDPTADGTRNLRASLGRVRSTKTPDLLPTQRYPVPRAESQGGGFEERFWSTINSPVFGDDGELAFIINRSEDLTEFVRAKAADGRADEGWQMLQTHSGHIRSEIALRAYDRRRAEELQSAHLELQESEARLRESADRFSFLAESMPQKIFTARANGDIDYFNRQWTEFTGLSFEQIRDWGWTQFIHPDDLAENVRRWKHSLETAEFFEYEHRFRRADGEWRWHISRAHAMRDAEGHVLMWIGSNTEIHDVKVARDEAEQANRTKDKFLAALSHELRTPLTPVLMCAAAMERDTAIQPEYREQLGMMRRNVELEARLIDDLLDLTRITRGTLRLDLGTADVHSLLAHTEQIARSDASGKGVPVQIELDASEFHVLGDSARLHQVFWNVLKNAIKFTPAGGRVTIRTSNPGAGQMRVEFSDTGVGIDKEFLASVFEPFTQSQSNPTTASNGLGLGMSIAKTIVELHGGEIRVTSPGLGNGATFTVDLSTTAASTAGNVAEPNERPRSRLPYRLLLVEDHQPTLEVLARLLRQQGHAVVTASTVGAARELAASQSFDLVISDLGLPDGSGVDLMIELTREHGLRGIALSGYGTDEDLARTKDAGFIAHLVKPVDFQRLNRVLERAAPAA
ncbi:MAG: ATP-binding protein [Verrucomicrobiota bacterium]|nr:ATP-binding protein [Verrucomicrobiota bacterium]